MIRFWFLPVLTWVFVFVIIWNIKRWEWSVIKMIFAAMACAIVSMVVVLAIGTVITTFLN